MDDPLGIAQRPVKRTDGQAKSINFFLTYCLRHVIYARCQTMRRTRPLPTNSRVSFNLIST